MTLLVSSKFLSFSLEILAEILFLLPARDIVVCSRTCKLLHTLVLETPLLQYVIYTHCAGVEDRFVPGLTIPERFARLKRWEEAWGDTDGLDPSGGRLELTSHVGMSIQSMLRDGFLVVARFKEKAEDEGIVSYSAIDLRAPTTGWRVTEIPCHIIAFDCSIKQNLVATLHTDIYERGNRLLLTLRAFYDSLDNPMAETSRVVFVIRDGKFLSTNVDLKIAGDFVGIMSCGEEPGHDVFTLVDWVNRKLYSFAGSPAEVYMPSFCFIDHETVGHIKMTNSTVEIRKIIVAGDGQITMKLRRVFGLPLVSDKGCQLLDAVWSGDHPSIPASSPVVWPDQRKRPSSALPFQSSLGSSIVALVIFYMTKCNTTAQYDVQSVRVIIPRADLLNRRAVWSVPFFPLDPLGRGVSPTCAISGTRWINRRLEVFDFHKIRVQMAQDHKRGTWERVGSRPARGQGLPNAKVEDTSEQRQVQSSFPYRQTFPINNPPDDYDDILADDERIVGLRYKNDDDDDLPIKILFDVHNL